MSRDYGVLNDAGLALRGTFLIDGDQVLRHISINDTNVGRNMQEYLRLVDAYNFSAEHGDVCPAQWKGEGDATMTQDHDDEKTQNYWKNHLKQ
jgi:alkyl hydroperoxide reductase subunit AhpC